MDTTQKFFKVALSGVTSDQISHSSDTKLTLAGWKYIEKAIPTKQNALLKLIKGESKKKQHSTYVIGDLYHEYRERARLVLTDSWLINAIKTSSKKPEKKMKIKKKKAKNMKKKDIIIAKNKAEKLNIYFDKIVHGYQKTRMFLNKPISGEPMEFLLLRLLLFCPINDKKALFKWVITAERTVIDVLTLPVAPIAITDLNAAIVSIKKRIKFTYEGLNDNEPANFLENMSWVENTEVKLYAFQEEFVKFTQENKNKSYIIKLDAMIGRGKTFISSHLAFMINKTVMQQYAQWRSNKTDGPIHTAYFYFICASTTVRTEVAKYCYSQQCPYSVVTWDYSKMQPTKTPANICKKTYGPRGNKTTVIVSTVMICDPISGFSELKNMTPNELKDITVFIDEPTMGAYNKSFLSKILSSTIPIANRVILSSATMPHDSEIKVIYDAWQTRHPKGVNITISAMESLIGCQLISMSGRHYCPHFGCQTTADIIKIINGLKTKPFVCRLYTVKAVFSLRNAMAVHMSCIDIEECISKKLNMSHTSMIAYLIILLQQLSDASPAIIKTVCSIIPVEKFEKLDPQTLGLMTFKNQTLVATTNPIEMAKQMLVGICDKKGVHIATATKLMQQLSTKFKIRSDTREKQLLRIGKRYTEKSKIDDQMDSVMDSKDMDIGILSKLQDASGADIFDTLLDTETHTWVKLCLISGIGIYPSTKEFGSNYKTKVETMASKGQLKFVIVDNGIIYGTNWPIGNVICFDDMAEDNSVPSLNQLFGRAGRVGKCYIANAFASDAVLKRILDYIINDRVSVEGANMTSAFNTFKQIDISL
jgi:hypothetical protein